MDDVARCPQCGGVTLSITEVHEEVGMTDPATITVHEGQLVPPGDFYFEPGHQTGVYLRCSDCEHYWRSRRQISAWTADRLAAHTANTTGRTADE